MISKETWTRIGFAIVWILAFIGVFASMSRYLLPHSWHEAVALIFYGRDYALNQLPAMARYPVLEFTHRFLGSIYLIIGPLQFMPRFRARNLKLHRIMGRFFIVFSIIAGITGLILAIIVAYSGYRETIPTIVFSIVISYSAYRAYIHARRREIAAHREWMIRSFAVGLGIVSIRIFYLFFYYVMGADTREILPTCFWLGWVGNSMIAEIWINYTRPARKAGATAAGT